MVQPRGAVGPRILYNNSEHSCSYKTDIHYYLFAIAKWKVGINVTEEEFIGTCVAQSFCHEKEVKLMICGIAWIRIKV